MNGHQTSSNNKKIKIKRKSRSLNNSNLLFLRKISSPVFGEVKLMGMITNTKVWCYSGVS